MGNPKNKKPSSKLEITQTVIEIVTAIANIILVIYTILKG